MTERTRQIVVSATVVALLIGAAIIWLISIEQTKDCLALLNC